MVGLVYKLGQQVITGTVPVPGQGERLVTVTAEALPGYMTVGVASWQQLYGRPATMELLAADVFQGAAGELLVPLDGPQIGALRGGRSFSNPGRRPLRWYAAWSNTQEISALDGAGHLVSKSGRPGIHYFMPETDDVQLEIEVAEWPTSHGSGLAVNLSQTSSRTGGQELSFVVSNNTISIRQLPGAVYPLDAAALGIWTIRRTGTTLAVTSPTGRQATKDFAGHTQPWGKVGQLIIAPASQGVLRLKQCRVSGVV